MAFKYAYYNGMGPFLYDSSIPVIDAEGLFPTTNQHALVTDGQLIVEEEPTDPYHVARKQNIDLLEIKLESESYFFARIY